MNQPYNELGHFPPADILEKLLSQYQIKTVLEIGTFLGLSAKFFAERVESVLCVDPFQAEGTWAEDLAMRHVPNPFYDVFVENMKKYGVWDKIQVLRYKSGEAPLYRVAPVDLVYIDGDHSYEGCASDIRRYKRKALKLIAGDDIHSDENGNHYFPGVHRAVIELLPGYKFERGTWWCPING